LRGYFSQNKELCKNLAKPANSAAMASDRPVAGASNFDILTGYFDFCRGLFLRISLSQKMLWIFEFSERIEKRPFPSQSHFDVILLSRSQTPDWARGGTSRLYRLLV
jgi:hypothetical protein